MQFEQFPKTNVICMKAKCSSEAKDVFQQLHECYQKYITSHTKYFGWKECADCKKEAECGEEACQTPYCFGISVPDNFADKLCEKSCLKTIEEGRIAWQMHVGPYKTINMCCCHMKEQFEKMGLTCRGCPFFICTNDPNKIEAEQLEAKLCWQIK